MTAAYADAENALGKEIVRLEGLIALRDVVREIGSLEGAGSEESARLESARIDEAAAKADLVSIRQQVSDAAIKISEAQAAAEDVLTKAKVAASAIVAGAKAEAAKILADAESATVESRRRAQVLSEAIRQAGT